jgi:hypothetical protein
MNEYKNFVGSILERNLLSFMLSSIDKLHQPKSKTLVFTTPAPRSLWNKNKGPITKVLHIKVQPRRPPHNARDLAQWSACVSRVACRVACRVVVA